MLMTRQKKTMSVLYCKIQLKSYQDNINWSANDQNLNVNNN